MRVVFLAFMITKISCLSKIWDKILRPYLSNSLTGMYYHMQNRVGWDYKKWSFWSEDAPISECKAMNWGTAIAWQMIIDITI